MYSVAIDPAHDRVIVIFNGLYDDNEMLDFERDLHAAALKIRRTAPHFDLLVDFSQAPVMPKDRAEDSTRHIAWCLANGLRRSANVTTSALMKLQLQRVAADPRFQYFTSVADAAAWLEHAARSGEPHG